MCHMKSEKSISNAQMKIMDIIWRKEVMMTVPEMVALLNEEGEEWAYQTVATFLKRLEEKKILGCTKKGNKLSYYPLLTREEYQRREAQGFVDRNFDGSLKNFLAAFTGKNSVDAKEIKELKEWLSEFDDH